MMTSLTAEATVDDARARLAMFGVLEAIVMDNTCQVFSERFNVFLLLLLFLQTERLIVCIWSTRINKLMGANYSVKYGSMHCILILPPIAWLFQHERLKGHYTQGLS